MNQREFPNRKRLHLPNFDYTDSALVFFVTICATGSYFLSPVAAKHINDEINFRSGKEVKIYSYCLMPNHLHLLLSLSPSYGKSLQNWVAAFKRHTAYHLKSVVGGGTRLWQKKFYEHVVRNDESLKNIAEYIVLNPVRKGMVENWNEFPHSFMCQTFPW